MRTNKNLLAVAAAVICCAAVVWFATSIHAGEKTYEIHPYVGLPYGYTPTIDAYRLIDLIEHLTYQNQQITQNQLTETNKDIKGIAEKLDSINSKLDKLSARIEGIENALGIEKPKPQTKPAHTKPHKKPSPQTAE